MNAYEVLTGVGNLYLATVGTAFPAVNEAPGAGWTALGETDGGVTVTPKQKIDKHRVDQRTGAVAASRSEEDLTIETSLALATLENLAKALGGAVTDTAPGVATIGYRTLNLYRGTSVTEYALLFRGNSPYGAYNSQFEVPRVYVDGDIGMEYTKDGKVLVPVTFEALENLSASTAGERFGKLVAQDAAATG
jgi:hypothetical protein